MADVPNLDQATAVRQESPTTYSCDLSAAWTIGSVPHGGYVTATIQRAVALHFATTLARSAQPHLLTLHLEFLRRTSVGPALVTVRPAKTGRQTSTLHVSLAQIAGGEEPGGAPREEVVGYITHADLARLDGPSFDMQWAPRDPPALPPPSPALLADHANASDPNWEFARRIPFPGFRHATARVRWLFPKREALAARPAGPKTRAVDMYMGLATRDAATGAYERWTTERLGFAADLFPQIVELAVDPEAYAQDRPGRGTAAFWFPTLLLNLEVKRPLEPPGEEWLAMRLLSREIRAGRYDIDLSIFNVRGELVALSTHVCFALSASRNLSKRGSFVEGGDTKKKNKDGKL